MPAATTTSGSSEPGVELDALEKAMVGTIARRFANNNWSILPLRPGTKKAALADWPNNSSCDVDEVATWYAPGGLYEGYPMAVNLKADNFVAIDFDARPSADGAVYDSVTHHLPLVASLLLGDPSLATRPAVVCQRALHSAGYPVMVGRSKGKAPNGDDIRGCQVWVPRPAALGDLAGRLDLARAAGGVLSGVQGVDLIGGYSAIPSGPATMRLGDDRRFAYDEPGDAAGPTWATLQLQPVFYAARAAAAKREADAAIVRRLDPPTSAALPQDAGRAERRLEGYRQTAIAAVTSAAQGSRNSTLNSQSRHMGRVLAMLGQEHLAEDIVEALVQASGLPWLEGIRTGRSGMDSGLFEPYPDDSALSRTFSSATQRARVNPAEVGGPQAALEQVLQEAVVNQAIPHAVIEQAATELVAQGASASVAEATLEAALATITWEVDGPAHMPYEAMVTHPGTGLSLHLRDIDLGGRRARVVATVRLGSRVLVAPKDLNLMSTGQVDGVVKAVRDVAPSLDPLIVRQLFTEACVNLDSAARADGGCEEETSDVDISSHADRPKVGLVDLFLRQGVANGLSGQSGVGKSELGIGIAMLVAGYRTVREALPLAGTYLNGPQHVLYLDWESNVNDVAVRMATMVAAGEVLTNPHFHYVSMTSDLAQAESTIRALVRKYGMNLDQGLIVIDTITSAVDGDMNNSDVMARIYKVMRRLNVTSLTLSHVTKADRGNVLADPMGHTAGKAISRNNVNVSYDPDWTPRPGHWGEEKGLVFAVTKNSEGPQAPPISVLMTYTVDREHPARMQRRWMVTSPYPTLDARSKEMYTTTTLDATGAAGTAPQGRKESGMAGLGLALGRSPVGFATSVGAPVNAPVTASTDTPVKTLMNIPINIPMNIPGAPNIAPGDSPATAAIAEALATGSDPIAAMEAADPTAASLAAEAAEKAMATLREPEKTTWEAAPTATGASPAQESIPMDQTYQQQQSFADFTDPTPPPPAPAPSAGHHNGLVWPFAPGTPFGEAYEPALQKLTITNSVKAILGFDGFLNDVWVAFKAGRLTREGREQLHVDALSKCLSTLGWVADARKEWSEPVAGMVDKALLRFGERGSVPDAALVHLTARREALEPYRLRLAHPQPADSGGAL